MTVIGMQLVNMSQRAVTQRAVFFFAVVYQLGANLFLRFSRQRSWIKRSCNVTILRNTHTNTTTHKHTHTHKHTDTHTHTNTHTHTHKHTQTQHTNTKHKHKTQTQHTNTNTNTHCITGSHDCHMINDGFHRYVEAFSKIFKHFQTTLVSSSAACLMSIR